MSCHPLRRQGVRLCAPTPQRYMCGEGVKGVCPSTPRGVWVWETPSLEGVGSAQPYPPLHLLGGVSGSGSPRRGVSVFREGLGGGRPGAPLLQPLRGLRGGVGVCWSAPPPHGCVGPTEGGRGSASPAAETWGNCGRGSHLQPLLPFSAQGCAYPHGRVSRHGAGQGPSTLWGLFCPPVSVRIWMRWA